MIMTVERAIPATIGEWAALRLALWPHGSLDEVTREAGSLLARKPAAVAFLLRDEQ